uniref:ILEI domain-containing protein n=1 Tax=Anisakis simplex TaxID=6269 RepID=A0A0M3JQS8_ANISI
LLYLICCFHLGEIPMSFYTGTDKLDSPSLCVNDHFIFDRDLNGAGRGLNLVIIDAKTHGVVRTGHFDTYEQVPSWWPFSSGCQLAKLSLWLSDLAKDIFYELGSSLIYKLKFRASWYFVGQKGIDGFSAFEDLTMPPAGSDWAKAINKKVCVPSNLSGRQTLSGQSPDRTQKPRQNSARRHFCARFDGYEDFCSDDRIDQLITARTLSDPKRASHEIFSIPILIVAGLNMNNVRICLESLMNQEGVNRDNILVTYNSDYSEVNELANLFGVRSTAINTTSSYNGFVTSSSIPSAVYRVEHVKFHGAYLLKRNAIEKCILAKESTCSRKAAVSGECVCNGYMPDVSRMQWIATDNELNNPLLYSFVHNTIDVIGDNMNGNESVTDSVEDAQSTDQQPARLFTT